MKRPIVIIESPFAPSDRYTLDANREYLRRALRHSYELGEIPFASHGFFPHFLDEFEPSERAAGIEMGYAFWQYADKIVFYTDHGWSRGMNAALSRLLNNLTTADGMNHTYETRTIGEEV